MTSSPASGHIAQIVSVTVWTFGLMLQKTLTGDAGAGPVLFLQFTGAAGLMWAALALAGRLPPLTLRAMMPLAWGMLAPGLVLSFGLLGAARTDGVSVALMWGLVPLLGPVLARVFLGEALPWFLPLGGLVSFTGLVAVTLDRSSIGVGDLLGNALVLVSVLCASASVVVGRWLNTGAAPWYQVATLQVTGASITAAVLATATGWDMPDLGEPVVLWTMAYLVLVMTILNFLAFNLALARVAAAWVAIYVSLVPAIGTLAAVIVTDAPLRSFDIAGVAVIVAGVALPHAIRLAANRTAPAR